MLLQPRPNHIPTKQRRRQHQACDNNPYPANAFDHRVFELPDEVDLRATSTSRRHCRHHHPAQHRLVNLRRRHRNRYLVSRARSEVVELLVDLRQINTGTAFIVGSSDLVTDGLCRRIKIDTARHSRPRPPDHAPHRVVVVQRRCDGYVVEFRSLLARERPMIQQS